MSQSIESADGESESVKKSVTVIGYAEDGKYAQRRGFANALDDRNDYWEDVENVNYTTELEGGENPVVGRLISSQIWGEFADEETGEITVDLGEAGEVKVTREKEVTEEKRYKPGKAVTHMRNKLVESVYEEHGLTGLERQFNWSWYKFQDDRDMTKVKVHDDNIGFERVLKPQDEREPGDRFKGDDEVMAVKFRFELGEADEELVDTWFKELVVPFMRELRKWDNIDNVEMADCETKTVQEGDCFDI